MRIRDRWFSFGVFTSKQKDVTDTAAPLSLLPIDLSKSEAGWRVARGETQILCLTQTL